MCFADVKVQADKRKKWSLGQYLQEFAVDGTRTSQGKASLNHPNLHMRCPWLFCSMSDLSLTLVDITFSTVATRSV